jgi:hypothetical protein
MAKEGYTPRHIGIVNRYLAGIHARNPDWLPWNNELFASLSLFKARVRAWSFLEGFDVVKEGGG